MILNKEVQKMYDQIKFLNLTRDCLCSLRDLCRGSFPNVLLEEKIYFLGQLEGLIKEFKDSLSK